MSSKPDAVEERLRREILTGGIGPRERINVRALEQELGVSHIPIREAIRRLEGEGLIDRQPNVGAVASGVSLRELHDLYDLRRIIEPPVLRRAAAYVTDAHVRDVFAALDRLVAAAPRSDAYYEAHWEFHWLLLEPGATELIRQTLGQLWRIAERYVRLTEGPANLAADEQHEQMARLLEQRRPDELAAVLSDHLRLAVDSLTRTYGDLEPVAVDQA